MYYTYLMTSGLAPNLHPGLINCRNSSGLSQNILVINVPFTLNFHAFFILGIKALNIICRPLLNFNKIKSFLRIFLSSLLSLSSSESLSDRSLPSSFAIVTMSTGGNDDKEDSGDEAVVELFNFFFVTRLLLLGLL